MFRPDILTGATGILFAGRAMPETRLILTVNLSLGRSGSQLELNGTFGLVSFMGRRVGGTKGA